MTDKINIYTYYGQIILFQTLAYPWLTVQRRIECMSKVGVGMLGDKEYKGIIDAVKRIFKEEGAIAFYRGYMAYILAVKLLNKRCIDNVLDECSPISDGIHDDEYAYDRWGWSGKNLGPKFNESNGRTLR